MTSTAERPVCPKGHVSTESDYCSECGAKLQGNDQVRLQPDHVSGNTGGQICPDCGTPREQTDIPFCEVCGYNFVSGAHGEVGILPAPPLPETRQPAEVREEPQAQAPTDAAPQRWRVVVSMDGELGGPESPKAPTDIVPFTIELEQPVNLIGRTDEARGIFPEIALPADEAVSRRHALLQTDEEKGLLLRDIGAANGTRLNGEELKPMVDYVLKDGDDVQLGHWSRLRVEVCR